VIHKYIFPLLAVLIVCSSCGLNISNADTVTATPDFVTSTLPPTKIQPPTHTSLPATPTAIVIEGTVSPSMEGTTTTQLNVRAQSSSASESLGIINQFTTVQVIGKDASGSWYQILYPDSAAGKGWVRAEFVKVDAPAEITVIGGVTGSGSGMSGLVIEKINVRKGPGTNFESLGVLNPKDVVFITGKDPSGEWLQIEFASAADGKGWAAIKFLKVEDPQIIPVIGSVEQAAETPTRAPPIIPSAILDGDSIQSPIGAAVFSATGIHVLQVNDDISSPDGDTEDWIQFTPYTKNIFMASKCVNSALQVELWSDGKYADGFALACGGKFMVKTVPGRVYDVRIQPDDGNDPQYVQYSFTVSSVE